MVGSEPCFHAYHADNAILIQFIISEFVQITPLIHKIHAFFPQPRESSSTPTNHEVPLLVQSTRQLIGLLPHREHPSFPYGTTGPLTKLKSYCEQFARNSLHRHPSHLALHKAACQTWLAAIHGMELLNAWQVELRDVVNPSAIFPLKRSFDKLKIRFNQLTRSLPRVIRDYRQNENVLLCLLRKKEALSDIYGSEFLYTHFKWPLQAQELAQWVIQRYRGRGFEALQSTILQLFENQDSCDDVG